MPVVNVTINGVTKEYEKGTTFEEIAKAYQSEYKYRIAAVIFNGKIRELMKPVKKDSTKETDSGTNHSSERMVVVPRQDCFRMSRIDQTTRVEHMMPMAITVTKGTLHILQRRS